MEGIHSANLLSRRSNHGLYPPSIIGSHFRINGGDSIAGGSAQFGFSPAISAPNPADVGWSLERLAFFSQDHYLSADPRLRLKSPKLEPSELEIPSYQVPDPRWMSPSLDPAYQSLIGAAQKRFRLPPTTPTQMPKSRSEMPSSEISRRRRKRIGDRTKILEGLMPWERRMDQGTMLAEAQKYVKFLEAQVTALQSMPVASPWIPAGNSTEMAGGLGNLSRQQLLQVMMGSPVVQDLLCKREWCLFSVEQVADLRREVARRPQLMVLLGSGVNGNR